MKPLVFLAAMLVTLPAAAAEVDFKAIFARHWQTSKEFTLAVAEAMPEESYDFKPQAEEMSFGRLMIHIADENSRNFARAAGTTRMARPSSTDKKTAIRFLTESFNKCANEFEGMTQEQLVKTLYQFEGRPVIAIELLWFSFTHTAHHRGQGEVYLRVKNIKPPDYRF